MPVGLLPCTREGPAMTTAARAGLCLEPLDTLFFRDGRPFDAANRVSGGLPQPQPLAGALRTALLAQHGFRFEHLWRDLRGQPGVPSDQLRELLSHYLDSKH